MNENENNYGPLMTLSKKIVTYFSRSQKSYKDGAPGWLKSIERAALDLGIVSLSLTLDIEITEGHLGG